MESILKVAATRARGNVTKDTIAKTRMVSFCFVESKELFVSLSSRRNSIFPAIISDTLKYEPTMSFV